jgi:hypothetical protein
VTYLLLLALLLLVVRLHTTAFKGIQLWSTKHALIPCALLTVRLVLLVG